MTSQHSGDSSLFSRVVREPLDTVVAPLVRDALVHDALGVAKLSVPPQDRKTLFSFVNASLRQVLVRALGAELGSSVVEEMLHALESAPTLATSRPPRPVTRIPRPRNAKGERISSVPPPSGRPSVVPPSGRPSAVPPSGRPSVVPDSVPPSVIPSVSAPSVPVTRKGSSLPPQTDLPALAPSPTTRRISSNPPPDLPATMPPPSRAVPPAGPFRPRPTPVPYGMRRPTPPPGMVDARSHHPRPGGVAHESISPTSSERVRARSSHPPIPSSALPRAPMVLVATQDRAIFETLAGSFDDRARIRRVLSAADVIRELDEAGGCRKIVILDVKAPTVRPPALAVLLESMPQVEVVLCRSQPGTEEAIAAVSPATASWIVFREIAPLDRVAEACASLVS